MCGGIQYDYNNQVQLLYFPNPQAKLPILKRNGSIVLLPWGRRQTQAGNLPLGGWARLESIHAGKWDKYFPKSVKIPAQRFMEKDYQETSHWFEITRGQYIQGLLARYGDEYRVYVVTIVPERDSAIHDRWPRLIASQCIN
jgi:hypothetical protein